VARLLARKSRRISKEFTATNQKVGSSNLSGRARFLGAIPHCIRDFGRWLPALPTRRLTSSAEHSPPVPQVFIPFCVEKVLNWDETVEGHGLPHHNAGDSLSGSQTDCMM
jgi:hypothetical protein